MFRPPLHRFVPEETPRTSIAIGSMLALALLFQPACHRQTDPMEPSFGTIEVTALTEGDGDYPESFTVLFNHSPSGTIVPNGTYTIPYLPQGEYSIGLDGLTENCWLGPGGRTVVVEPDETSYVTFLVRCG